MTVSHTAPADLAVGRPDLPAAGIGAPGFDRILEVSPGIRAEALLNVTGTLPFFDSHFPRRPILPGVLLTESMVALAVLAAGDPLLRLRAADGLRFRRFVTPGDQVRITVEAADPCQEGAESRWRATARVDEVIVAAIRNLRLVRGPIAEANS
ncbi:3-hydroxyacyl-ACP dehydratase FabZ family protein [Nocardia aurantiaca]|uniref:Hydroxymyristoyl-ACP dehydratase n=1 Tax=Nocardia aurantiaca TaxID=2675850 RepID=A0A6I3KT70_9NOCA|nr:hydroxymyristoyl-ACP dehydratase [Nocardia aurantiaca]MTE12541.1 hydroxymyristoyl-ACP dehydratase [Nocardia aurantiaca]